jgi:predicted amidohydrolase
MNSSVQEKIHLCLLQSDIHPTNIKDNLNRYRLLLETIEGKTDIIVFPEMFACGFSNNVIQIAESYTDLCFDFLHSISQKYHSDVVASLPVMEKGRLYNRLVWIQNKNVIAQYDKRHLFFGCEKQLYKRGNTKTIVNKKGWNFLPLICYDVRFPNWCRNQYRNNAILYDCILFIANFPASRSDTFRSLLIARAIENQSYAIGLNRIGIDGFGNRHCGNSIVVNPLGKIIAEAPTHENYLLSADIDKSLLTKLRNTFPIYMDWDENSD